MDILKNPIVIGMLAGVITYMYLSWEKKHNKKNKHKKDKEINLLIPLVVAMIGWFIAYAYLQQSGENKLTDAEVLPMVINGGKSLPLPFVQAPSYTFTKDVLSQSSISPKSFSLLTGGVAVPSKLPDVMIDMY